MLVCTCTSYTVYLLCYIIKYDLYVSTQYLLLILVCTCLKCNISYPASVIPYRNAKVVALLWHPCDKVV